MKEKVVLAYSGGLDTSYCVKYLSEELGLEVYTALANTGGFTEAELKTVEKKAYALGAKEHVNLDVTEDYYSYTRSETFPGNGDRVPESPWCPFRLEENGIFGKQRYMGNFCRGKRNFTFQYEFTG